MEQTLIGECEGVSQSYVSKELIKAKERYTREQVIEQTLDIWTAQEIQYIHFLPREIISDIQVLAFIENILGIFPIHPFFSILSTPTNLRIAALASLGIQNKRLMVLFNKNQPTISMTVKRSRERAMNTIRQTRYQDQDKEYRFKSVNKPFNFMKAGGIQ